MGNVQEDWQQSMVHWETHSTYLEVYQLTLDLTIENHIFGGNIADVVADDSYYSFINVLDFVFSKYCN